MHRQTLEVGILIFLHGYWTENCLLNASSLSNRLNFPFPCTDRRSVGILISFLVYWTENFLMIVFRTIFLCLVVQRSKFENQRFSIWFFFLPHAQTDVALVYDAVQLLYQAVHELFGATEITPIPLRCEEDVNWSHGVSLVNYIKLVCFWGVFNKMICF